MRCLGIVVTALALGACATQSAGEAETAASDCFRPAEIRGYGVVDQSHVRVLVGAGRRYTLTTMWDTHNLDWTQAIAIRSGTGLICTGNGLGVELIGGEPRRSYPVVSIERAADEEPAAQGS